MYEEKASALSKGGKNHPQCWVILCLNLICKRNLRDRNFIKETFKNVSREKKKPCPDPPSQEIKLEVHK